VMLPAVTSREHHGWAKLSPKTCWADCNYQ